MIKRINSILRGWSNYHRHIVSKKTFNTVDGYAFLLLWKWARRQHPKKSAKWIKAKYFYTIKGRKWLFGIKTNEGKLETRYLATSTPIKRHVLIKVRLILMTHYGNHILIREISRVKNEKLQANTTLVY